MSEHLPECIAHHNRVEVIRGAEGKVCLTCEALRAREQRVLTEAPVSVFAKAFHDGQSVGFDKGVQAARDAVAAAPLDPGERVFALAAIDALKGADDE